MKLTILALLSFLSFSKIDAQRIAPDMFPTGKGTLTIQPLTHATVLLSLPKLTIYVDPSGESDYTGLAAPTLILITDIHGDHFDVKTINAVKARNTVLVVPKAVADKLPDSLKTNAVILNNGDKKMLSGITITAIPMYNLPEKPDAMHTKGRGNG